MNTNQDQTPVPQNSWSSSLEDKDIFQAVLDTRNLEITLFWQRSNYFLALNSALAVGYFAKEPTALTSLIAVLGITSSILWYRVVLGSKYWQSRWEDKLFEIESRLAPTLGAFASRRVNWDEAVSRSLHQAAHTGFQAWLDSQIMKKPSVTLCMTVLSMTFLAGWALLFALSLTFGTWHKLPTEWSTAKSTQVTANSPSAPGASGQPQLQTSISPQITVNPAITVVIEPRAQPGIKVHPPKPPSSAASTCK
jgi:hypothetical protein